MVEDSSTILPKPVVQVGPVAEVPAVDEEHAEEEEEVAAPELVEPQVRRFTREHRPSTKYPSEDFIILTNEGDPECLEEVLVHQEKMPSLHKNQTYDLVKLPKGIRPLKKKWVYKLKKNADGSIAKYKAWLVVKGFEQKEGIDFSEIFAPVVKMTSIRVVMSLDASLDLEVEQKDVKRRSFMVS